MQSLATSDLVRSFIVLAAATAQSVTVASPELFGFSETVISRVEPLEHGLTPIGYAFAIWGVIYAGNLAFAVWQALPANRSSELARQVGWWAVGMYLCNAVWQIWVPAVGADYVSTIILGTELIFGMIVLLRMRDLAWAGVRLGWRAFPLGLLTGWVSAATFVNLTTGLIDAGSAIDPRVVPIATTFLIATITFCVMTVASTRSGAQALGICWGFHAIAVANIVREPQPVLAATAMAGLAAVALTYFLKRFGGAGSRLQVRPLLFAARTFHRRACGQVAV